MRLEIEIVYRGLLPGGEGSERASEPRCPPESKRACAWSCPPALASASAQIYADRLVVVGVDKGVGYVLGDAQGCQLTGPRIHARDVTMGIEQVLSTC